MIKTRFAPSPTGYLHIGGLRTALFNFLYARANGGEFLLRIEDTDFNRNSIDATNAIIEAFKWVGMDYDQEIVYQSKRINIYKKYIDILLEKNLAYYCYMTKEELDSLRETQKKEGKTPRYDNRYRDFKGIPPSGVKPVVRIKIPLESSIIFNDALKGRIEINTKEMDDYIIMRSDGTPTYNFVVAIDDALMGISDIIRGDDHLTNTPKQIIIYQALDFKIPNFCHIPMILNPQGKKLSKRDGALNVMEYKEMGILPEALLNFLLRLGFSYKDKEIFSMEEMIDLFTLKNLSTSASAYNETKLLWLNNHYIKNAPNSRLENLLNINLNLESAKKEVLFKELKDRSNTIIEFKEMLDSIFKIPESYEQKMLSKIDNQTKELLNNAIESITNFNDLESISQTLHHFATTNDIKIGKILTALRCAILGKNGGIGVNELIFILGKDEILKRIEKFLTQNR
ncbi:glutamate--tRNA ligase [Helicobacter sp. 16-1353]|uniref:glutamate--tRNA ligase n=1 Tax=Helicobacter sp. 16-1353 TaxID=2004996 RepID=UPI000DCBCB03|nr:glutamate--tRNA ligase [Helicobacter sp. 16-1353]RAX54486.1 glutamate--tRNA ligase [Helicobacter sp. 16-1353]